MDYKIKVASSSEAKEEKLSEVDSSPESMFLLSESTLKLESAPTNQNMSKDPLQLELDEPASSEEYETMDEWIDKKNETKAPPGSLENLCKAEEKKSKDSTNPDATFCFGDPDEVRDKVQDGELPSWEFD